MHLCSVARTLSLVFFLVSKADASTNATASPAPSRTFSTTANQPNALLSDPLNARDEERAPGIKDFGLGTKFSTLLAKTKQAVKVPIADTQLLLKVGWWRLKSADPSIVYTNLKLDQVKENILSNFWFRIWVRYVDNYNLYHPGTKVSVLANLEKQFDDHKLAMMLDQAKSKANPSIKALGTRLQKEQMNSWRNFLLSPKELYSRLQSDPSHPILLTGSEYEVWNIYLSEYNPGWSMTPFDQLLHFFSFTSLSSLLITSKKSEKTATMATNLQLELENFWLSKDEAPELVFKYLRLDQNPSDVLGNPELKSWMRYTGMYQEKTGKDVTLAQVLVNLFETDKIKLIIRTADIEGKRKLAENLERMLAKKIREDLEMKLAGKRQTR